MVIRCGSSQCLEFGRYFLKASYSSIKPNQWSGDINSGSGRHNFQVVFDGVQDSSNKAVFYDNTISDIQSIQVKSPPKPTPQSDPKQNQMLANAQNQQLSCGPGTHQENNLCVTDGNPALDVFSSIFANIEGFFKSLSFTRVFPVFESEVLPKMIISLGKSLVPSFHL